MNATETAVSPPKAANPLKIFLNIKLILVSYLCALGLYLAYSYTPDQFVEEDGYEQASVMEKLQNAVTPEYVTQQIKSVLDQDNIEDALMYKELADMLKVSVDSHSLQRIEEENTTWKNAWRGASDFSLGFISGEADNMVGVSGSMISDLTLVGDIRDFSTQTKHYMNDEPVDEFIYALSILGVGATVATVFSAGLATPAKTGISVLKVAKKTGGISKGLFSNLSVILRETVDLKKFKNNLKGTDYTDVGKIKNEVVTLVKTAKTDKVQDVFSDIQKISNNTSVADTVKIMKYADNTDDLKRLGNLSGDFGKNSRGVLTVLGKKALKVTKKIAKSVYNLMMSLAAFIYSLIASLLSFIGFLIQRQFFSFIKFW